MNKPLTRASVIRVLRKQLPTLNTKYGVAKMAVYGSFAKGTARSKSDVDILVELTRPLGLEFVQLAFDLEKSLGRKVDLATFDTFHSRRTNPRYAQMAMDIERTMLYV